MYFYSDSPNLQCGLSSSGSSIVALGGRQFSEIGHRTNRIRPIFLTDSINIDGTIRAKLVLGWGKSLQRVPRIRVWGIAAVSLLMSEKR